ncbi:unnamed protein product, partial [Heterotrigona itama]
KTILSNWEPMAKNYKEIWGRFLHRILLLAEYNTNVCRINSDKCVRTLKRNDERRSRNTDVR